MTLLAPLASTRRTCRNALNGKRLNRGALLVSILAWTGLPSAAQATTFAVTLSNPLFPSASVDAIDVGNDQGFIASIPLPTSPEPLEFPWDIDSVNGRLFAIGTGQDNGTSPPTRTLDEVDAGTIWSTLLDGSDPQLLASGLDRPLHLDVTPDGSTVFFAEQGTGSGTTFQNDGRIARLDVATGVIETVVNAPLNGGPTGVDFDPTTGLLFYQVNNRGQDISVQEMRVVEDALLTTDLAAGADDLFLANPTPTDGVLDEAEEFTVLSAGRNVAVHDGFVYFTYRNSAFAPTSEIRRIPEDFDLALDDPETFETVVTGVRIIDFEIAGDQLIWTDPEQNAVFQVSLGVDGLPSGSPMLVTQGAANFSSLPIGVAVVPEPGVGLMLAAGVLGLATIRGGSRRA